MSWLLFVVVNWMYLVGGEGFLRFRSALALRDPFFAIASAKKVYVAFHQIEYRLSNRRR
jgi:hypothetical protein